MSTALSRSISSLMRKKMRRCESSEKSSDSSFSAASACAALSSRIAPRIVFSASTFAGSPASIVVRFPDVAISEKSRPDSVLAGLCRRPLRLGNVGKRNQGRYRLSYRSFLRLALAFSALVKRLPQQHASVTVEFIGTSIWQPLGKRLAFAPCHFGGFQVTLDPPECTFRR